jgi:hypothetical protein
MNIKPVKPEKIDKKDNKIILDEVTLLKPIGAKLIDDSIDLKKYSSTDLFNVRHDDKKDKKE